MFPDKSAIPDHVHARPGAAHRAKWYSLCLVEYDEQDKPVGLRRQDNLDVSVPLTKIPIWESSQQWNHRERRRKLCECLHKSVPEKRVRLVDVAYFPDLLLGLVVRSLTDTEALQFASWRTVTQTTIKTSLWPECVTCYLGVHHDDTIPSSVLHRGGFRRKWLAASGRVVALQCGGGAHLLGRRPTCPLCSKALGASSRTVSRRYAVMGPDIVVVHEACAVHTHLI